MELLLPLALVASLFANAMFVGHIAHQAVLLALYRRVFDWIRERGPESQGGGDDEPPAT